MKSILKKIKFETEFRDKNILKNIEIKYIDNEFTSNSIGKYSLYLNDLYVCFEIETNSNIVVGFNGFFLIENCIKKRINPFQKIEGCVLKAALNGQTQAGCGTRIKFDSTAFYDETKRIIVFGSTNFNNRIYQIFKNLFVQIDDDGYMNSVIIYL